MPCGDTVSATVQHTYLTIDRSCCITTSLTASSEATSWALAPTLACCCCACCCLGAGYAISRGWCPSITRRLDVLRGSGFSPKYEVCSDRRPKPSIRSPRSALTFGSTHKPNLELSRYTPGYLEDPHWSSSSSESDTFNARSWRPPIVRQQPTLISSNARSLKAPWSSDEEYP
ncbi:NS5 [Hirame aquareovirus]|nr:NS5 [Hirame aquareovirus]